MGGAKNQSVVKIEIGSGESGDGFPLADFGDVCGSHAENVENHEIDQWRGDESDQNSAKRKPML